MTTVLDIRRHQELIDTERFDDPVIVIGAGATGSWLVLQLAKLGITNITVYDFDVVEEHNVPNQLFGLHDVGTHKVEALYEHVLQQTGTAIFIKNEPYVAQRLSGYVFCMVDSMAVSKQIWEQAKGKSAIKHFVEPRMGLDYGRVYNVNPTDLEQQRRYEDCFYSDDEAEVSACGTSQTVITTAMNIASHCARQLINHHNGVELGNEIMIDLMYNNVIATKW